MSLARVACIIPARDEAETIAATVTAASRLPGVQLVIVADDGSSDATAQHATAANAILVSHQRSRGTAAAVESAVNALGVFEARDGRPECGTVLLVDAGLGARAAALAPVVRAVVDGSADLAVAVGADDTEGLLIQTAALGIHQLTDWSPRAPLATNRCLTRRAYELASPLAAGHGLEVGMAVDLRRAGLRIEEIDVDLGPAAAETDLGDRLRQAARLKDVTRALTARGLVRSGLDDFNSAGGLGGLFEKFRR